MLTTFLISLRMLGIMTILTGILYPIAMTLIGMVAFRSQTEGSVIVENNRIVGSALLGQSFTGDIYLHGRLSTVNYMTITDSVAIDYTAVSSGASNLGPTSSALAQRIRQTDSTFKAQYGVSVTPMDMLTVSGSGVDPHITPEAAFAQIQRIIRARGLQSSAQEQMYALLSGMIEKPQWGIFGMPRLNVLRCNLALDTYFPKQTESH